VEMANNNVRERETMVFKIQNPERVKLGLSLSMKSLATLSFGLSLLLMSLLVEILL
jgi:hypothetical protein